MYAPTLALVPGPGLLFGLLLASAIVGGYISHALRIPRVVGYILAGVGLKLILPAVLGIEPDTTQAVELAKAAKPLQSIKELALGLVLFSFGRAFEVRRLRGMGTGMLRVGLAGAAASALLVSVGVFLVGLAVGVPVGVKTLAAFSLLLGLAAMETAPAATMFTLQEYEAKGSTSDSVLGVTGLAGVLCLVSFLVGFLLMAKAGLLGEIKLTGQAVWMGMAVSTLGSIALGAALGFVMGVLHAKLQIAETLLILIATLIVVSSSEHWLLERTGMSYNALLTALCMGTVFVNVAIDPDRMEKAIGTIGPPLFVGFFVLAGYKLDLGKLSELGGIGAAYIVCRVIGKIGGSWLGVRWAGPNAGLRPEIGIGLLCHASIVIGVADYVATYWLEEWPRHSFLTTILGSAVLFEVCGPLLLKRLVVQCGEVKAVTLMRRTGASPDEGQSIISLTVEATLRALRFGRVATPTGDQSLQVRHLMRTNVKTIPAEASFDEVMHIMEASRFNHFPVTTPDGKLMGLIRLSDLREIIYDPAMTNLVTAADLADPSAKAVSVDTPLEQLLAIFQDSNLSSLPVITDAETREVVGVVEQRDLLRALRPSKGGGGH